MRFSLHGAYREAHDPPVVGAPLRKAWAEPKMAALEQRGVQLRDRATSQTLPPKRYGKPSRMEARTPVEDPVPNPWHEKKPPAEAKPGEWPVMHDHEGRRIYEPHKTTHEKVFGAEEASRVARRKDLMPLWSLRKNPTGDPVETTASRKPAPATPPKQHVQVAESAPQNHASTVALTSTVGSGGTARRAFGGPIEESRVRLDGHHRLMQAATGRQVPPQMQSYSQEYRSFVMRKIANAAGDDARCENIRSPPLSRSAVSEADRQFMFLANTKGGPHGEAVQEHALRKHEVISVAKRPTPYDFTSHDTTGAALRHPTSSVLGRGEGARAAVAV